MSGRLPESCICVQGCHSTRRSRCVRESLSIDCIIQGDLPHVNFEAISRMKLTARTPGTPSFFFLATLAPWRWIRFKIMGHRVIVWVKTGPEVQPAPVITDTKRL